MVDAGFENQKELTKMQLDNQKEIAEMQNETQKEIAGIQSATSRQNTKDQVYAQNEMLAYQQKESTARVASFFFSSKRRNTKFKCDWSSDVCSSDLPPPALPCRLRGRKVPGMGDAGRTRRKAAGEEQAAERDPSRRQGRAGGGALPELQVGVHRSEERRVGKERRSRWSPYH